MPTKRTYRLDDAPSDLPYSPVTQVGTTLYVSGQVGIDPDTKQVVSGGIGPQTRQTITNLERVLALAGATLQDVVKVNAFLTNMGDFGAFNTVYREFFRSDFPSRTTVGTSGLASPEMVVEIDAIAVLPS